MRVAFSPWRHTSQTTAAAATGNTRSKSKRNPSRSRPPASATVQASFVVNRSFRSGGGGTGSSGSSGKQRRLSKRQKRRQKQSTGQTSSSSFYDGSAAGAANTPVPLLTLTSEHQVCVLSGPMVAAAGTGNNVIAEDPRWSYESRPGSASSFLPVSSAHDMHHSALNGDSSSSRSRSNKTKATALQGTGIGIGIDYRGENDSPVPALPAIFDASAGRIFALQNGNTILSCWDSSDPTVAGPDDCDDDFNRSSIGNASGGSSRGGAECGKVALPAGRYAVSMQCLPTADASSYAVDGLGGGVAGVLDDGTVYVARFVPYDDTASGGRGHDDDAAAAASASLKIGYFDGFDADGGLDSDTGRAGRRRRRRGLTTTSKRVTASAAASGGVDGESMRHLTTIISPGSGGAANTSSGGTSRSSSGAAAQTATSGRKRRKDDASYNAAAMASLSLGAGESYTVRVLFYDHASSSMVLFRHSIMVRDGAEYAGNRGSTPGSIAGSGGANLQIESESHAYPPIHLSQPPTSPSRPSDGANENESEAENDNVDDEEPLVVDPKSIRCARLDSTAMAVAFRAVASSEVTSDTTATGTGEEDEGLWYCIHLEGRSGDVTTAPFPLEVLPGRSVHKVAGLSPNLVAVLSSIRDNFGAEIADNNDGSGAVASLMVYDIRRSAAVQTLGLPLKGRGNGSLGSVCWDMLSDYKDGTIAVVARADDDVQSVSVSVSKLILEANDRFRNHPTTAMAALRKRYSLASAIASAVSVSDDIPSSAALSTSVLGRDIRSILPKPTASSKTTNGDGGGVETIVSETMHTIDDAFVAFELDGLRAFLFNSSNDDAASTASSFEGVYDQAVSSLLRGSPSNGDSRSMPSPPKSIVNGSSHKQHGAGDTCGKRKGGGNTTLLPQSFVDGVFYAALDILLQSNDDTKTFEIASAQRVLVKLLRTGKIAARDHLGSGVLRTILLASRRLDAQSIPEAEKAPSALNVIDNVLTHCSDDIPEAALVTMLHHVLCYISPDEMIEFFSSDNYQICPTFVPSRVRVLVDERNDVMAERLLIENEKTTKKKGKAPSRKRQDEINVRMTELNGLADDLRAKILAAGTIHFADRVVSYSNTNGSLLRSALVDVLVHAERGEVTTLLSVLTKLLLVPTVKSSAQACANYTSRTTGIAEWVSALTDAHLAALLDAEGLKLVAAARAAVAASAAQADVLAKMQDLIRDAISSCSVATSAQSKCASIAGNVVKYDTTGKRRSTAIKTGKEDDVRSRPVPAYCVEWLSI